MEGIRIRLGRFTEEGARMLDLSQGAEPSQGFSAYIVYPHLILRLIRALPGAARAALLLRMTTWEGEAVRCLFDPLAAAYHGCGGCLVDLAFAYGDEVEIESLRILATVVREAHPLGLPVACRVILGPEVETPVAASHLDVPLTIAEEMGADCLVAPEVEKGTLEGLRKPLVPLFIAAGADLYERRSP